MTSERSLAESERQDRVLDEFRAANGVKVERVSRNGYEERHEVIKVYGTRSDRYSGFNGEVTERKRKVKIAEFPAGNTYEILVGLAEAHGCELEGA